MRIVRPYGRVAHGFLVALASAAIGLTVSAQRQSTPPAPASKLTTVLADLAGAVPQTSAGAALTSGAQSAARVALDAMPKSVQDAARERRLRLDDNNEIQVYILLADLGDETLAALKAAGATIEISDPARLRVQARVSASRLQAIAALGAVNAVRLPTYARRRTGSVTSEGDHILNADAVRLQYGLDGTGVRVGVASDGLKGVFATACTTCGGLATGPIASGDLPAATGTRDASGKLTAVIGGIVAKSFQANGDLEGLPPASPVCAFQGAGGEGTALLEVVHDVAPGAKLSFANADTDLEFAQAVNFLAVSNDVVLDDVGFFGEPYDGTSAVSANTAAALNNATNPIRTYLTAVGNDADEHYYGAYTDSGVDGTALNGIANAGHLHLFQRTADTTDVLGLGSQPYNVISLPSNGEVAIFLTWDDAFGASANNYDLYLVQQSTGKVVARSTDVQNGRQDPVETIDYVNNTGTRDYFRLVVQNVNNAAKAKNLNIFSLQPECAASGPERLASGRHERHNYNTAARSVSAQGDAGGSPVSVISVGAICSASSGASGASAGNESCLDTSNSTAEFFSSRGPTLDGRVKPDIAAIDGVSITGAGSFPSPFFGTSAAVPHVGGIAALMLQSAPCLMNRGASTIDAATARATARNLILHNAIGLSGSSPKAPNDVFGYGRADALRIVQPTLPTATGRTTYSFDGSTPFGASITPSQLGFTDPNRCSLTRLNWTGGCGTGPGATMTCPIGTSNLSVSASNNGVSFGPPANMTITVTGFALGATPSGVTVSAGQPAVYTVTVSAQGGPFGSTVALGCGNLPPQTACTFNPPTVNPGKGAVTSRLTITTTAASAMPPLVENSSRPARPLHFDPPAAGTLAWLLTMGLAGVALRRARVRRAVVWATACAAFVAAGFAASTSDLRADSGIALFPSGLRFGSQTVGTASPPQNIFVTNTGGDALTISSVGLSSNYSILNATCGTTLNPGASCGIAISFVPTSAGTLTGLLQIADNSLGSPHSVSLTGTGVAASTTTGATPSGSYGISITGTAGTYTQLASVTLAVQ